MSVVGNGQAFQDFNGRRLAGAVRAEESEALAIADRQIESVDRFDIGVVLLETAT